MLPRSLRWRLSLLYAAVIAVALAVVLALVGGLVERALIDSTAARLEVEAGLITPTGNNGRGNAPATTLAAGDLARVLGGQATAVVILDATGQALASEPNGASPDVADARLDPAAYRSVLTDGTARDIVPAAGLPGGRVLIVVAPIRFAGAGDPAVSPAPTADPGAPSAEPGPGRGQGRGKGNGRGLGNAGGKNAQAGPPNAVAQLAISLADVDATMAALRGTLLAVGIAAFLVGLLVTFVVTALGLRPLGRVVVVADRVAAGDLSARAGLPLGQDEIGRLGRAFDQMVDRLEHVIASQRQFAADASHELRSPLTVLGGYVDVLATGVQGAPEGAARILTSMRREIDRLSRLAADLLLLTQLEAGGGRLHPERLDVGDLLADLGAAARVIAEGRQVEVRREGPLPVVADRDRLTQALLNLVDNAARHTPEGGLIRLTGRREEAQILAEVFNEGPPIPAGDLPRLFDRFYRADRSVEPGRHAGLGLAIAKAIAETSNGTVTVTSDASGTRFVVRLPVDAAGEPRPFVRHSAATANEAPLP